MLEKTSFNQWKMGIIIRKKMDSLIKDIQYEATTIITKRLDCGSEKVKSALVRAVFTSWKIKIKNSLSLVYVFKFYKKYRYFPIYVTPSNNEDKEKIKKKSLKFDVKKDNIRFRCYHISLVKAVQINRFDTQLHFSRLTIFGIRTELKIASWSS